MHDDTDTFSCVSLAFGLVYYACIVLDVNLSQSMQTDDSVSVLFIARWTAPHRNKIGRAGTVKTAFMKQPERGQQHPPSR